MKRPGPKVLAVAAAINFVGVAALPHRVTSFYPPRRHTPRGVAIHVLRSVLFIFALRKWVLPQIQAHTELHKRANAELTERLGREPTLDELTERMLRLRDG